MPIQTSHTFYLAHGLSKLANALIDIFVITFAVAAYAQQSENMGYIMFFKYIPFVIFGIYGGKLSDRHQKIRILYHSEWVRAAFCIILYLSIYYENFALICLSLFCLTAARCFYQPAQQSLISECFPKHSLKNTNSLFQAINELTELLAPILLGLLISLNSGQLSHTILLICLALYLIAYILFFTHRHHYPKHTPHTPTAPTSWHSYQENTAYLPTSLVHRCASSLSHQYLKSYFPYLSYKHCNLRMQTFQFSTYFYP